MLNRRTTGRRLAAGIAALLAVGAAGACGPGAAGSPTADGRLRVVTAFYPLQFISERIGGDAVTVSNLTKPGAEPHDLELNPRQVAHLAAAGLVVYLKGFQPAVDQAVEQVARDRALDVSTVAPLLPAATEAQPAPGGGERAEAAGGRDPHLWLDPVRLAAVADRLTARLAQADPGHAADYQARGTALRVDLTALDRAYEQQLTSCARREIVTSHSAFGYLAARYRLTQVGITGIDPEAEPSTRRLGAFADEVRRTATTTIFFETLVSPKVADTVARTVGARTAVLDPLEGLTEPGGDYLSVMRANLAALVAALDCR